MIESMNLAILVGSFNRLRADRDFRYPVLLEFYFELGILELVAVGQPVRDEAEHEKQREQSEAEPHRRQGRAPGHAADGRTAFWCLGWHQVTTAASRFSVIAPRSTVAFTASPSLNWP